MKLYKKLSEENRLFIEYTSNTILWVMGYGGQSRVQKYLYPVLIVSNS